MTTKIKSMTTDLFSKLPDTTIHILKVECLGEKTKWYKSKDAKKITEIRLCFEKIYGKEYESDNTLEFTYDRITCKDTLDYCDENAVYSGINSFKGILL